MEEKWRPPSRRPLTAPLTPSSSSSSSLPVSHPHLHVGKRPPCVERNTQPGTHLRVSLTLRGLVRRSTVSSPTDRQTDRESETDRQCWPCSPLKRNWLHYHLMSHMHVVVICACTGRKSGVVSVAERAGRREGGERLFTLFLCPTHNTHAHNTLTHTHTHAHTPSRAHVRVTNLLANDHARSQHTFPNTLSH